MSRICPKCGTELEDGTLFCINCGTKLDDAPAPNFSQPVDAAPAESFKTETEILTSAPAEPVRPDVLPFAAAPTEPARPEPQPFANTASPAPKTSTEAAFGVAPEAPGANYNQPPYYENPPYPQPPMDYQEPVSKVVSVGGFFWLDFLYWIPGIGLLACIIIAIASRNLNIKHHACARLVSLLVAFVILIILCILTVIAITQAGIDFNEIFKRIQDIFYLPY